MEAERGKIQSGQGMIKVKTRTEVKMERCMYDHRLWVRTRKSRDKKEASGD